MVRRRAVWIVAALFVALQASFFLAVMLWPATDDLPAAVRRLQLWLGLHVAGGQLFVGAPLLVWLAWRAPVWQVRLLIGLSFALLAALLFTTALEMQLVLVLSGKQGQPSHSALQFLTLLRLADFALALGIALMLRLAWRAEHLRADTLAPASLG